MGRTCRSPRRCLSGEIVILVASALISACGGGDTPSSEAPAGATTTESLDGSTMTPPASPTELIPMVCQDMRQALNDWSDVDLAVSDSTGKVIGLTLQLNIDVGQGVTEEINQLIDQLNSEIESVLKQFDAYDNKFDAFNAAFEQCVPLLGTVPQACSDEMSPYPQVTAARAQKIEASAALLRASVALRDALIAGDDGAVDVAIEQIVTASDQLSVAKANWNDIVTPPFNAAIEACNAAIS